MLGFCDSFLTTAKYCRTSIYDNFLICIEHDSIQYMRQLIYADIWAADFHFPLNFLLFFLSLILFHLRSLQINK